MKSLFPISITFFIIFYFILLCNNFRFQELILFFKINKYKKVFFIKKVERNILKVAIFRKLFHNDIPGYYFLNNYFVPVTLPILFLILIINLQTKSLPIFLIKILN